MSLREVRSLRKLNHPCIVKLREVIRENNELFFIFEFLVSATNPQCQFWRGPEYQVKFVCLEGAEMSQPIPDKICEPVIIPNYLQDYNLYQAIKQRQGRPFPEIQVKSWAFQIFQGLDHMHRNGYFHRDMKPGGVCHQ